MSNYRPWPDKMYGQHSITGSDVFAEFKIAPHRDAVEYIRSDLIKERESQIAFNDQLREILECACMHATLNSQCALKIGEALNLLMKRNKL